MARRVGAMLGILVILLLVAGLVFEVYKHHEKDRRPDDAPEVVRMGWTRSLSNPC